MTEIILKTFIEEIQKNFALLHNPFEKRFNKFCLTLLLGMTSYDHKLDKLFSKYTDDQMENLTSAIKTAFGVFSMEKEEIDALLEQINDRKNEMLEKIQNEEKEIERISDDENKYLIDGQRKKKDIKKECQVVAKNKDFKNAHFDFSKESPVEWSLKNKKFWTNRSVKLKGKKDDFKFNKLTNLLLHEVQEQIYLWGMLLSEGEEITLIQSNELDDDVIEWCKKSKINIKNVE